jgi:hypothetical protein
MIALLAACAGANTSKYVSRPLATSTLDSEGAAVRLVSASPEPSPFFPTPVPSEFNSFGPAVRVRACNIDAGALAGYYETTSHERLRIGAKGYWEVLTEGRGAYAGTVESGCLIRRGSRWAMETERYAGHSATPTIVRIDIRVQKTALIVTGPTGRNTFYRVLAVPNGASPGAV